MLDGIVNDRSLAASHGEQLRLGTESGQVNSKLEKKAGPITLPYLRPWRNKIRVRDLTAKLNQLSKAQRDVAQRIGQAPAVAQPLNLIGEPSADEAPGLKAELKMLRYWHYLIMATVILVALALNYLLQMKVFSHQRLIKKCLAKGLCQNCGVAIGPQDNACALFGCKRFKSCDNCTQSTYVFAPFCRECG